MLKYVRYIKNAFHKKQEKNSDSIVEYNPEKIQNVLKKYDELTNYVLNLENLLKKAEKKTHSYEDILSKYEKLVKEEISLYRLQQSNVSILNKNFNENELFLHEIQRQIQSFLDKDYKTSDNPTFQRLFNRFFHQNELYKSRTHKKLIELNETIEKKNRMLERMQHEITSGDKNANNSYMSPKQLSLKHAVG